ncbi:hypothetical protein NLU13_5981 [Sarocladium strictum]|uniref:Uncharacterized protein n=1 Tax=Sarocladium strictum TaxID=5046 RepID=A0AA39GFS3_SARSR|nr:hypothetical protein NLU13_5981 [Sarocladium strictum]
MGLSWGPGEDGGQTRQMDSLESLFLVMAELGAPLHKHHWSINSSLRLSFPNNISDPVPYLQQAWLAIRRRHPTIAAIAAAGDSKNPGAIGRQMTVPALDPQKFVEKTFFVHKGDVNDATELAASMKASDYGTIHWIPATEELLVNVCHWQFDGMGVVMLWSSFLEFLAAFVRDGLNARVDDESNFTIPVDELVASPMNEESTPKRLREAADAMIDAFLQGMPGVGPPLKSGEGAIPGTTFRRELVLDEPTTKSVIEACKKNDYSVSAMVQTAMLRVLGSYQQHPAAKHYSIFIPVDLRKLLPAPHDGTSHAGGTRLSGWPLLVENVADKSFADMAPAINQAYRTDFSRVMKDDEGNDLSLVQYTAPYARRVLGLYTATPPAGMPPRTTPCVSSLGMVEKYIQAEYDVGGGGRTLGVRSFFLSLEMLGPDQYIHVWTFRGKLHLQMSANSTHYDADFLDDELESIKRELVRGLGVTE